MDQREYVVDWEETLRTAFAGLQAGQWHAMPGRVTVDSADGHTVTVQPTVKRLVTNLQTGERTYEDHPEHPDVPVKFASGGGVTHTFPLQQGLEGLIVYANRDLDGWHQSGDTQQPVTDRMHGYADPTFIPGLRSDPRKLQAVSTTSSQIRSEDGHHVADHDPAKGITHFSADPSTPAASEDFTPFTDATKFLAHGVLGASGLVGRAVDGGTEHSHGVFHGIGAWMKAMGADGLVQALAHPLLGGLLSSADGKHLVQADPNAGVTIASKTAVAITSAGPLSLSAPPGQLSLGGLMGGSIPGGALGEGAAAQNIGSVGGDLAGSLPSPTVVNLGHVDASTLPLATSDSAAAAAGVPLHGLYRDTSIASGKTVIVMRAA